MNVFTKNPRKSLRTSWSTLHVYVQKFLIENTRDGALRNETFYWDGVFKTKQLVHFTEKYKIKNSIDCDR